MIDFLASKSKQNRTVAYLYDNSQETGDHDDRLEDVGPDNGFHTSLTTQCDD